MVDETTAEELLRRLQVSEQPDREGLLRLVQQLQRETQGQNDWCEAAGQSEPLTTRLKNLLKDYPADVGLFKEMVQNADDAGATKVHFVWDRRAQGKASILTPQMAAWQTPCLWAYNDALFTEQDFEAICRLGVGGKRKETQRIGRFGLGFNSVYNLTDLPSILSGDLVLFLDPHVRHLQAMGASTQKPGIKLKFLKVNALERFRDQFQPYSGLFGCDLGSTTPFPGTLIRIPFRTKETAATSEISQIVVDGAMRETLCEQFHTEAFQWLLFLRNVREISVSQLTGHVDTPPVPELLGSVSLAGFRRPDGAPGPRPSIVTCGAGERWAAPGSGPGGASVTASLEVACRYGGDDKGVQGGADKAENSVGPPKRLALRRYHLFTDTRHGFSSRVCLAVPLAPERDAVADLAIHSEDGRVFCFLPVPRNVDLGLRVHVHAPLNMAQDRRSVLLDDRIGESERELVQHNFSLLEDLVPGALLACLLDLAVRRNQMPPAHFFNLFPALLAPAGRRAAAATPAERVARTFYGRLVSGGAKPGGQSEPCPPLPVASPGPDGDAPPPNVQARSQAAPRYWVPFAQAVFIPSASHSRDAAGASGTSERLLDEVVRQLLRFDVPLVDTPPHVLESVEQALQPRHAAVLTPRWLRQYLRSKAGGKHALPLKGTQGGTEPFSEMTAEGIANFLEFALSDGDLADLDGVPLLLCEDEQAVQTFRTCGASGPWAFVPQSEVERRLLPPREGRRFLLASRLEKRPVVWAQLKEMAFAHERAAALGAAAARAEGGAQAAPQVPDRSPPGFQCRLINFALLVEALQRLLPRSWNEPVPHVGPADWVEWVESWLQALWRWLDQRNIPLSRMAHWPVIPGLDGRGGALLFRVPEPHKMVLFSVPRPPPAAPAVPAVADAASVPASGPTPSSTSAAPPPPPPPPPPRPQPLPTAQPAAVAAAAEHQDPGRGTTTDTAAATAAAALVLVGEILERCLQCKPVWEPPWLVRDHEKSLRDFVHPGTADGLLSTMHMASKLLAAGGQAPRQGAHAGGQAFRSAVSAGMVPGGPAGEEHLHALVVTVALAQRGGCSCASAAGPDWKSRCEVVRSLPLFSRFNQPATRVALLDVDRGRAAGPGGPAHWGLLPDTCPNVVAALRAANVELPPCIEIPTVASHTTSQHSLVAGLLRELALPRLQWADVLQEHVFPWVRRASDTAARQTLMLAMVQRWREMELAGNASCTDALQQVPFVGTAAGDVLCPAQVLDPAVERLRRLYATSGSAGPFPDVRFLTAECRAVLRYRKELSYRELSERLEFLHGRELARRGAAAPSPPPAPGAAAEDQVPAVESARTPPELLAVAQALMLYIADNVALGLANLEGGAATAKRASPTAGVVAPPSMAGPKGPEPRKEPSEPPKPQATDFWSGVVGIFSSTFEAATGAAVSVMGADVGGGGNAGPAAQAAPQLSEDELTSLQSKMQKCFWLPIAPPPRDWPQGAPWRGLDSGLCSAEEVRFCCEEALVGMVRPLVGVPPPQPAIGSGLAQVDAQAAFSRPPRSFLQALGCEERPGRALLTEQLLCLEAWAQSLPERALEAHGPWITQCLYGHLYPVVFATNPAQDGAEDPASAAKLWVPQGGFVRREMISKQTIEFPPYLVRAPAEWREKIPSLWALTKEAFTVVDFTQALHGIQDSLQRAGNRPLAPDKLEMAVRLVMAITDLLQQDKASGQAGSNGVHFDRADILMPTSENTLRRVQECVFNNMTWLPDVETAEVALGTFCLVHPKISHAVAHACGCRGLSLVYAREATEMAGADWFEAAGQSEPMTTRLKNLLKDYPADISMFKEMTQNADDAGATRVHFVWDWRQHRKQSLLTPDMDSWQGPALWVFNDATFSQKDFESICKLGVGGKREASRKIGRFGLGFNSVYNFTDLPSILSDDVVLFLDPHVRHLQAMGASVQKPGIKLRFLKINVLEKFRDQFEPYHGMLGCNLSSSAPFHGTLMRVPFRTQASAKQSEICDIVVDQSVAEALNHQFRSEAFQWLLFLQSVAEIRLSEIPEDAGGELRQLACVRLQPEDSAAADEVVPAAAADVAAPNVQGQAAVLGSEATVAGATETNSGVPSPHEVGPAAADEQAPAVAAPAAVSQPQQPQPQQVPAQRVSAFRSEAQAPVVDLTVLAESSARGSVPAARSLHRYRLVPGQAGPLDERACVAVPLQCAQQAGPAGPEPLQLGREEGRLFCFLPLPRTAVSLRLAAHVHAPVNTTQDRRSVVLDDRVGERELVEHNVRLLDLRIPESLMRCVAGLSGHLAHEEFFRLFPTLAPRVADSEAGAPGQGVADRVAHAFYRLAVRHSEPLFPTVAAASSAPPHAHAQRVAFHEAVFFSSREGGQVSGTDGKALITKVAASLARFGVPVVELPVRVLESVERVLHPVQPRVLTPAWLRQFLRAMGASMSHKRPSFPIRDSPADAEEEVNAQPKNGGKPVAVSYLSVSEAGVLLAYAISDGEFQDLEGVPLLVTEDLAVGTIAFTGASNAPVIFVPDDEDEYGLLPQAPARVLSRQLRDSQPWVWQHLRRLASAAAAPAQGTTATGPAARPAQPPPPPPPGAPRKEEAAPSQPFQLRRIALDSLLSTLQALLPQAWNVPAPVVTPDDWSAWVEAWLQALWRWLGRMSVPTKQLLHWPLIPSVEPAEEEGKPAVVRLHRLLPNSALISAEAPDGAANGDAEDGAEAAPLPTELRGALVALLQRRLGCVPVWGPGWLIKNHMQQLRGFLLPCTPDGFLTAAHIALRRVQQELEKSAAEGKSGAAADPEGGAAVLQVRRQLGADLSPAERGALAIWLSLARQDGCLCQRTAPIAWKRHCRFVRAAPVLCPFSRPDDRVALVDAEGSWTLLPEACPEVVTALRAAGVELATCVEAPPPLSPADAPAVASLIRELSLERITWAQLLLEHIFPWAATAGEQNAAARQGIMLAVVRRWREMELAGQHDVCAEALQRVPFVTTVGGAALSPSDMLDPTVEELRRLYGADGTAGPFPAPEVFSVLLPAVQRNILRFRQELSVPEVVERLTFLHKHALGEEDWERVRGIAESLLQYVAAHIAERCLAPREDERVREGSQADVADGRQSTQSSAFFLWPTSMRLPLRAESAAAPAKVVPWSDEEVELLKAKLQACAWLPAASAPSEWLGAVPWAGGAARLWKAADLRLMPEFWACGAVTPLLCVETQLGLPGDKRQRAQQALLAVLGISARPTAAEQQAAAWAQLDALRGWWGCASSDARAAQGVSTWLTNCLYRHVYPSLAPRAQSPAADAPPGPTQAPPSPRPLRALTDLYVEGNFVDLRDISQDQGFPVAGLVQLPAELRGVPFVRSAVKAVFGAADCRRALGRLKDRLAAEGRQQLLSQEVDAAVRLSIALADRAARGADEAAAAEPALVPTSRATLRPAHECVFNNMKWLSPEEQHKRSMVVTNSGLDWVHPSISNEVAQALQVQGLNAQVAAEALATADGGAEDGPTWFEAAGQQEPLTTRLRSLVRDMADGASLADLSMFKELLQNADDAQATEVHFVWDWRRFGTQSLMSPEMARWQGPCLWAYNNAAFSPQDFENITQLGAVQKKATGSKSQIGRFGLGFNSVYSFTDLPSILSDDVVLFLDPHVRHLRAMGASAQKPGIKLRFLKIDVLDKFRDQFEPYHGLFGCDLSASTPFKGTLIRVPFRTAEAAKNSLISPFAATPSEAVQVISAFRNAAAQCLLFLQHVQKVHFCWVPQDAGLGAVPTPVLEVCIVPPGAQPSAGLSPLDEAEAEAPPAVALGTDEEAFQYRRLFSSRTLPQSRERRSFITSLLSRMGLPGPRDAPTAHPPPRPFVAFNLLVATRWTPLPGSGRGKAGGRVDLWRLFLQHDDPEDATWSALQRQLSDAPAQVAEAEGEALADQLAASTAAAGTGDFVPFAGLALCVSRQLSSEEPRISCFLPLPLQCSLPFLINANFMLSDPESRSRLDLTTCRRDGATSRAAEWNRLLLQKLVEPMIRACVEEQAVATQAPRRDVPSARWINAAGGICALLPVREQLPPSLQELLNLRSFYSTMRDVRIFPSALPIEPAPPSGFGGFPETATAPLLFSYVGSVQPLAAEEGSDTQRRSVHEYVRDAGPFALCDVDAKVSEEFAAAEVKRQAELTAALVVECLARRRVHDAGMAAHVLAFLLTCAARQGADAAATLRGLPLAPLCDGAVGTFGGGGGAAGPGGAEAEQQHPSSRRIWCAFPQLVGSGGGAAARAQEVLRRLCPHATLDVSGFGAREAAELQRCAPALGVTVVDRCEHLAAALSAAMPSLLLQGGGGGGGGVGSSVAARVASALPAAQLLLPGGLGGIARSVAGTASSVVSSLLGGGGAVSEGVPAGSIGLGGAEEAAAALCGIWGFAELAQEGLSEDFLEHFEGFLIVPACNLHAWLRDGRRRPPAPLPPLPPPPPAGAAAPPPAAEEVAAAPVPAPAAPTAEAPAALRLLALTRAQPLLVPPHPDDRQSMALLDAAGRLLPGGFLDPAHPAISQAALRFLARARVAQPFGAPAMLAALAAAVSKQGSYTTTIASRCAALAPEQKDLLCEQFSEALCELASEDDPADARVGTWCSLPIFLSEAGLSAEAASVAEERRAHRSLLELLLVDGPPLALSDTRLDLAGPFLFRESPRLPPALASALALPAVQQFLKSQSRYLTPLDWFFRHVTPHLADLAIQDQVAVLERLLPHIDSERSTELPGLVPAEVAGGGAFLQRPRALLDTSDITIQQVFGASGESTPALPRSSPFHFPVRALSPAVRSQLRRLGMRTSSDPQCLLFLLRELRARHAELDAERYGELQRSVMQRIVECWPRLYPDAQELVVSEAFVDVSPAADGGEVPDSLFALTPFRRLCGTRLLSLSELVSRLDPVDPYLCWTRLPLSPRGFPQFPGYKRPTVEDAVAHARSLGELADSGALACHLWADLRSQVVAPLCKFFAEREPFRSALAAAASPPPDAAAAAPGAATPPPEWPAPVPGASAGGAGVESAARTRISAHLRRVKFLAVPLDIGSDSGPHALVAPWRISLVLREHRPPMFALPAYLQEHVPFLRLLGVRDALELPQGEAGPQSDSSAAQATEEAMRWLFDHGAESFADVTVRCDGGCLFLHRNILMARSDYFRAMFQQGPMAFREGQEGGAEVNLLHSPLAVARVLLGYLYHGRVDEGPLEGPEGTANAAELLCMSDELGVRQLFEFAQLWVANQQDLDDCADTLELASRHRAETLERATLALLASNIDAPEVEAQLPRLSEQHREALQELVSAARRPRP